jgi:hypothetical protein
MTAFVNLSNIDGKIWNLEYKVLDIVASLQKYQNCIIDLNHEGPCCESLGLYDVLDEICDRFGFDRSQITIRTCNQLEHHDHYQIEKYPPLYITETQNFIDNYEIKPVSFNDHIKHFGLFIGRSNWNRLYLASYLWNRYQDKSIITFHFDINEDYHRPHIGLDDLLRNTSSSVGYSGAMDLLSNCPIKGPDIPSYPILSPSHFGISKIYHDFFLEIVCETYCQGNSFYPTEKIWRPLANKKPFLIFGPKNYYKNLKVLGFRTFSNWWDESFTNDDLSHQLKLITAVIDGLSQLDQSGLEALQIDMEDTLQHNRDTMKNLTGRDFKKFWK